MRLLRYGIPQDGGAEAIFPRPEPKIPPMYSPRHAPDRSAWLDVGLWFWAAACGLVWLPLGAWGTAWRFLLHYRAPIVFGLALTVPWLVVLLLARSNRRLGVRHEKTEIHPEDVL